jgi:competence ComEA-like helix-hairpin-helix protein
MKSWQLVSIGILIGIILTGIILLIAGSRQSTEFTYLSPTYSSSSLIDPDSLKVNINTASIFELDTLPGIGPEKAKAIIDFRENFGKFISIEDLLYVPGIGQSLFDQIRDKITVQ